MEKKHNDDNIKEPLIGCLFGIGLMVVVFLFVHFVLGIKAFS
ncbi:hypothetical protein [Bacillus sp. FJAT-45350]|nr:hypothetical protein [Bacillus sp. FJAT-45350]